MFQLYLEDQLYVAPRLSILAGAQAIFAERHFKDDFCQRTRQAISQIGKIFGDSIPSWERFTKSIARHRHS